jgi:hypothetical protein
MQQMYSDTKHKTILQEMARVYGPASQDYHHLKGLLLRNDSPASMAAVDLHMRLMQIEKQAKDIDRADKGTSTGFWNNFIDNDEIDPGTQGTIDAFSSLAGSLAKGAANKDLAKTLGTLNAKDLQELKSEHQRIYRRDIGDMVENTNGLSNAAREAFNKLGIN